MKKQLIAAATLLSLVATQTWAGSIVTNRYDFEPSSGYVTESGWTHMDQTIAYTGSSAGFDLGASVFLGGYDRVTSTQSPTNVTRDLIIGWSQNQGTNATIVFRDILPAETERIHLTIWRSDPADSFGTYFQTKVSVNGGPLQLINAPFETGFYHTPTTGMLELTPSPTAGTLDFYFFHDDAYGPTNVRINGIEALYVVPEPSTIGLLLIGGLILRRTMRRGY